MKEQRKNKLSLEKFQIAKINNPQSIMGGLITDPITRPVKPKKVK